VGALLSTPSISKIKDESLDVDVDVDGRNKCIFLEEAKEIQGNMKGLMKMGTVLKTKVRYLQIEIPMDHGAIAPHTSRTSKSQVG
jgi:hypothetical protein